jgi:hypothetical protein
MQELGHRRVYLDQSAYGRMCDSNDWRTSDLGSVLLNAQRSGKAQVWAGPTNVLETIQASDAQRRKALASATLELIDSARMWWGHEFEAIQDFFLFLTQLAPDALANRQYLDYYGNVARQTWLGVLALAAANGGPGFGPVAESLRRTKTMNRLIHARFAVNPGEWVDRMSDAASNLATTESDVFADIEQMTVAGMQAELEELKSQAQSLGKKDLKTLNKHRANIAKAYGAFEVGALLQDVFTLPFDLEVTLDVPHILSRWRNIQTATGCGPLPKHITGASGTELPAHAREVIRHAIRASAHKGLMTTSIGMQVILLEMQRGINQKKVPTGGLVFDADHAAALCRHEIIITHDEWLAASLKTLAKYVEEVTEGNFRRGRRIGSTARASTQPPCST